MTKNANNNQMHVLDIDMNDINFNRLSNSMVTPAHVIEIHAVAPRQMRGEGKDSHNKNEEEPLRK